MSKLRLKADIGYKNTLHRFSLSLVEFEENDVTIIYSPALDLSGYGYDKVQAENSFQEALKEFIRYTNNKKTLNKALEQLGWIVKGSKKKPKFQPPLNSELASSNPLYYEIVNNKNHRVCKKEVELV